MQSFQLTAIINEQGKLVIPAPLEKAGARLRLLVVWEEESAALVPARGSDAWKESIRKFRGAWKNSLDITVDKWNKHKHEIWQAT
ncbi:MAG TPA: hypothetical protein VI547_10410 [Anaerolineales bacterium]|nr:hypothetical protein [Anaerolineales bacterium]